MTAPTGNTAPLDHVLPDDPSTWKAIDHAVAIANLRGAIIAGMREGRECPSCGETPDNYLRWEHRDTCRAVARENAALRERVARLKELIAADAAYSAAVRNPRITASERSPLFDRLSNARWATQVHGDLDGAGEGGE